MSEEPWTEVPNIVKEVVIKTIHKRNKLKIKKGVKLSLPGDNIVGYLENSRELMLKPT